MGAKFGSLHVLGADVATVKRLIKTGSEPELPAPADPAMAMVFEALAANPLLRLSRSIIPETYHLNSDDRGVNVYSEVLRGGFGSSMLPWFSELDGWAVSVGCFDEDFLEVALARAGRVVTRLVAGENSDSYGKYPSRLSPGVVMDVFGVGESDLEAACDTDDVVEMAERLGGLLGLPFLPQGGESGAGLSRLGPAVRRWSKR